MKCPPSMKCPPGPLPHQFPTDVGLCPRTHPEQWPLSKGSPRAQALRLERLSGNGYLILFFFTITITGGDWKEERRGGRNCSLKHSSVLFFFYFFQLLLFDEEPPAEACHSALGAHLTLLSPPCTWCVFAAVLITLTPVFINILNQCRRLC